MQIVNLTQGSPEWHAHRATHFNASDAPSVLGISPHMSREELLKRMATGIAPEITPQQQYIFDRGHAIEAACRPHAEKIIGETLAPIVGAEGKLSASFDGITFDGSTIWECKTLNANLRSCLNAGAELPESYLAQVEQQLMLSGADKCLFNAATITQDGELDEVMGCWIESTPAIRQRIIDGWAQFARDLAEWQPSEAEPAQAIGKAPDSLPALRIDVQGQVLASNLAEFKAQVVAVFAAINTDLQTDQDFADAEKTAKWCKGVEDKLEQAKENALSQTASIEEIFRTADDLKEVAKQTRLTLERAVKAQKEAVKTALVVQAQQGYASHISKLQLDLKGLRLNVVAPNFGEAIKGLKTVSSMKEKLAAAQLEAQSLANSVAGRMVNNLLALDSIPDYAFLFNDRQTLVEKDAEVLEMIIAQRVEQHKKAEQARLDAERDRIRAEEEAKAQVAAQMQVEAQIEADRQQRIRADEKNKQADIRAMDEADDAALASAVVNEALSAQATLNVTAINARLSPISLSAAGIAEIGIEGKREGKSTLYTEAEFIELCRALTRHIRDVATGVPA